MPRDVIINNIPYSINKIADVFEQAYLLKLLAPILPAFVAAGGDQNVENIIKDVLLGVKGLDKQACKDIYATLLSCVKRKNQDGSWSNIYSSAGLQFQDIALIDAMKLCQAAFAENFSGFFQGSGSILAESQKKI